MRKIVVVILFIMLSLSAMPAAAADLVTLPSPSIFGQDTFKALSKDLGFALSYFPLSPAGSLAGSLIPFGFDAGVEVTAVQIDTAKPQWQLMKAAGGAEAPSILPVPKAHVQVGFKIPFIPPIDLGVIYSKVPTTTISLIGYEVKVGILEDGIAMPAVALRASATKLSGLEKEIDLSTQQFDISVSKKILLVTPYLGYGILKISSTPKDPIATTSVTVGTTTIPGLTKEEITENKLFAGVKLSLGLINLVAEIDKAEIMAYSARFNLSF
jgi:hypothetical protein